MALCKSMRKCTRERSTTAEHTSSPKVLRALKTTQKWFPLKYQVNRGASTCLQSLYERLRQEDYKFPWAITKILSLEQNAGTCSLQGLSGHAVPPAALFCGTAHCAVLSYSVDQAGPWDSQRPVLLPPKS